MHAVKEVLLSSTAHGVPNVIRNRHILMKMIWLISILVSLSGLGYFMNKTLTSFFNYDVITNINRYKDISTQFPTVTFCFNSSTSFEFGNMLIMCEFNLKKCNETDFEIYFNGVVQEVCFRFNSGKNSYNETIPLKYTNRSDIVSGLRVLFNYDKERRYYSSHIITNLYVHNYTNYFVRDLTYNIESGIPLTSGVSYIQIEREFNEQLSNPYNDCVKQDTKLFVSKTFQEFMEKKLTYLQKDCIDVCIDKYIAKKCNCQTDYCTESEAVGYCADTIYNALRLSEIDVPQECFQECPPECDKIFFRVSPYYIGNIPEFVIEKQTFNNNSYDSSNLVYFVVYYSTLDYTLIKQIPKTEIFDLVSNIGGMLGLFIGISFLSFIEIAELFYEFIYNSIKSKKKSLI